MNDSEVARNQLKSIVERIERLHEEKEAISDDIRDIYAEAKANGFDTKVLRHVVKLRGQDRTEREEFDAVTDLYLKALGMLPDFEPQNSVDNVEQINHAHPRPAHEAA